MAGSHDDERKGASRKTMKREKERESVSSSPPLRERFHALGSTVKVLRGIKNHRDEEDMRWLRRATGYGFEEQEGLGIGEGSRSRAGGISAFGKKSRRMREDRSRRKRKRARR